MPDDVSNVLSISAITQLIRTTLENRFPAVTLEGEISNFNVYGSGHAYFTLKDATAQISAVMFAGNLRTVAFTPSNGQKVRVTGAITVYPQRGNYQILVRTMRPAGAGDLMAQFEALKNRLAAEGLFNRKRPLPLLPRTIGVVTSPSGAVIHDILNVTRRRFPNLHILLAPVRVQGEGAAAEIADAIRQFNTLPAPLHPDVLIVGRGGGSMEDLWCFNDECVARAVYDSAIPVISSVGHETDFTICDFVADLRAPTPSAAAEIVVGRRDDFLATLQTHASTMTRELGIAMERARARLDLLTHHAVFARPQSLLEHHSQHLDHLGMRMDTALQSSCQSTAQRLQHLAPRLNRALEGSLAATTLRLQQSQSRLLHAQELRLSTAAQHLDALNGRLQALNPLAVLQRGFGVVRDAQGHIVRSTHDVAPGDTLTTRVADGVIHSTVKSDHAPTQLQLF